MAFNSLSEFINKLDAEGELVRIREFVSPELEITEIADRVSKQHGGGKALLFENTGTQFPLFINGLGSERRICTALNVNLLDDVGYELRVLMQKITSPAGSIWAKLALLPQLKELAAVFPKTIHGKGKCQQVVMNDPDLSALPILTCWPADGGRFITLPAVHTKDPETGARNVGMYRMQVFDGVTTGMHWHKHKTGANHFKKYKRLGVKMPVAVTLGGDPAYIYAATAPMPENIDEYLLAGFLRKKKVEMVRCLTQDIEVPSDVDFVIEGYVDPSEEFAWEGPFGDHTGFYSLADWYPKFHVTCITHRKGAIYPATIVGIPPQEDAWIGKATERIFLTPIQLAMAPELTDMVLPTAGVAHNIALVSIEKEYAGQPQKVMNALWGAGQMMFNKILVVTDSNVRLSNFREVAKYVSDNCNLSDDLVFASGPLDVLDHSSSQFAVGGKLGVDATRKDLPPYIGIGTKIQQKTEAEIHFSEITSLNFDLLSEGISVVTMAFEKKAASSVPTLLDELKKSGALKGVKFVLLVDPETDLLDWYQVAWMVSGNVDTQRDCHLLKYEDNTFQLVIDGTRKSFRVDKFERDWPNLVVSKEETVDKIDSIWHKLGLGEFLLSPSLKYRSFKGGNGAVYRTNEDELR